MSLTIISSDSADEWTVCASSVCSSVRPESRRSSLIPITPFIGVRIS